MGRQPTTNVLEIMTAVRTHPEITSYRELAALLHTTRQTLHTHLGPRQGSEKIRIQTCFKMRRERMEELKRIIKKKRSEKKALQAQETLQQNRSYRKQFYIHTVCDLQKCLSRRPTKVELHNAGIYESTILQDLGWPSMNAFWIDVDRALAK